MNLAAIAMQAVQPVNSNIRVTVMRSTGYATAADGSRTPSYDTTPNVSAQVQSLSNDELHQLESLNIQGNKAAVYLRGSYSGIVRADQQGGDLLQFQGHKWLAVTVLENWGVPGTPHSWTKLALVQQLD